MIYIVEDDNNIRKLVSYALSKDGYRVKDFPNSRDFWKTMEIEIPKLILLDIMLPEEDGFKILKKLKANQKFKNIAVIMLTARTSEFDKVMGLDLGADDYIAKPFGMLELSSRVKAVLRRYNLDNENVEYRVDNLYVNTAKHVIKVNDVELKLSFKEYSLLLVLLSARGRVVSREVLLNKVWDEYSGDSRTLDVHIRRLRSKLGESAKLIKTVKNIGYKLGVD